MKLPNGYGSVYKLSGKRRKPWVARKTVGYTEKGQQIKKIIACAETKQLALQKLADYNSNPYDINLSKISFNELYNKWIKWKFPVFDSKSKNQTRYRNAFKYYNNIRNKPFIDISLLELQDVIDKCNHGYSTKSDIKTLYSQLYDFAKANDLPVRNINFNYLKIGDKIKSELHIPFTEEEIKTLWKNVDDNIVKLILINIYTGFRPKELLNPTEINLDKGYIISGCKTEAGINRIVPIHNRLPNLIKETLLTKKTVYSTYSKRFKKTMIKLNMNHTPYDCRHTFATRGDNVGMNKLCIKLLLGHAVQDLTDGTYTHKNFEQLKEEINKLH